MLLGGLGSSNSSSTYTALAMACKASSRATPCLPALADQVTATPVMYSTTGCLGDSALRRVDLTDEDEEVTDDSDLVFFNAPAHPSGTLDLALDTPGGTPRPNWQR